MIIYIAIDWNSVSQVWDYFILKISQILSIYKTKRSPTNIKTGTNHQSMGEDWFYFNNLIIFIIFKIFMTAARRSIRLLCFGNKGQLMHVQFLVQPLQQFLHS